MQTTETAKNEVFDASAWKLGIVVADFNKDVTSSLLTSALETAASYQIDSSRIDCIHVAGSVEIPLVLQEMAKTKGYDALLALGCIIRGDTAHFDFVAKFVTEGVLRVQLDQSMPIGFGVLTCENKQQALERINLGAEFLEAALHQAKALEQLAQAS